MTGVQFQVKISDFGLSRALGVGKDYYQSNYTINLKLPIAWCAPECINYLRFTTASDVWSYGVTLWEFFTFGFQPWAGLNGQQVDLAPHWFTLQPACCLPLLVFLGCSSCSLPLLVFLSCSSLLGFGPGQTTGRPGTSLVYCATSLLCLFDNVPLLMFLSCSQLSLHILDQ